MIACSRNSLLSEEDRGRAPCIHQALQGAAQSAASGDAASPQQLCGEVERRIADGGGRVDYVEVGAPSFPGLRCLLHPQNAANPMSPTAVAAAKQVPERISSAW